MGAVDMRNRLIHPVMLITFLLYQFAICLASESPNPTDPNRYLNAVREFADNVLKYGRDTYGPKKTPLFVDGLNIHNHEPVRWIEPNGDKWVLSNLASQQNLFRTLDGLTTITGDSKYRQAAMDAIRYAFEHLQTSNGLLPWGGHQAYDATTDTVGGKPIHELKAIYPYYELMWKVDPSATEYFIGAFWSGHIANWSVLSMDRHCYEMNKPFEEPWKHPYRGGPVFLRGTTRSFFCTGVDLIYAAAELVRLSEDKEPLVWAKRLAKRYVDVRDPKTGLSYGMYTLPSGQKVPDSYDDVLRKLVPGATDFPAYAFPDKEINPIARAGVAGYNMSTPGVMVHRYLLEWLSLLRVGEMLGSEGEEIRQWALQELTAYGKGYREDDNVYIPMLTDGTNLEGYVVKVDGPLGPRGVTLEPMFAGPSDLLIYATAYRVMSDRFMWELARNISKGNGFGDIGASANDEPRLNLHTHCIDPYAILSFLELYKATGKNEFLDMAKKIGSNVLDNRLHKGFFVASKKHTYSKFDTIDSLVLLHLHVAFVGANSKIPAAWLSTPSFEGDFRMKQDAIDNAIFYTVTELSEPPLSLLEAAAMGDVDLVKSMLEKGVDVNVIENSFYCTALHSAAQNGHKDVAKLLLSAGANIEAVGSYPYATSLYHAVQQGHGEVVKLLIAHGADINVRALSTPGKAGDTPLHAAVIGGQTEIVKLLLKGGADVDIQDRNSNTPFVVAINARQTAMAEFLISNSTGTPALHKAACAGDLAAIKNLIAQGGDVNAKDERGWAPLFWATCMGRTDVIELLIDEGADVAITDNSQSTALHKAVQLGNIAVARALIDHGADVNAKGRGRLGLTPLHLVLPTRNKEMVELLVRSGADMNIKNFRNLTPLDAAKARGLQEMVELLNKLSIESSETPMDDNKTDTEKKADAESPDKETDPNSVSF